MSGSLQGFLASIGASAPKGQQAYTTAGTYTWVAPAGVTSVCVVCVGGGGGGYGAGSGNGGALAYKNNYPVVPGNSYTVVVGSGGAGNVSYVGNETGSQSYFVSTSAVQASGGLVGINDNANYVGDGGGKGGYMGGGAGGYSGNGGNGSLGENVGLSGNGGGGGGGAQGVQYGYYDPPTFDMSITNAGGGGGGVGILGQSSSGSGGNYSGPGGYNTVGNLIYPGGGGGGGSGGSSGQSGASNSTIGTTQTTSGGNGGSYGGGGGRGSLIIDWNTSTIADGKAGNGGSGAVRIIWGTGRSFPSTNTGNV